MADKKKISIKGLTNTLQAVSEAASSVVVPKSKKTIEVETTEESNVIDSVNAASQWLGTIRESASPAMMQVISTQMQMLDVIASPAMTGMFLDNMVSCLEKALEASPEEQQGQIRELYAQMIQNTVFVLEAKMSYAQDKASKEAHHLIETAGTMMENTLTTIASMATPVGGVGAKAVKISNVLVKQGSSGLIQAVSSLFTSKRDATKAKDDFAQVISDLFDTLDKYHNLFGSSIIINGMLAKYKRLLVDKYTEDKMRPVTSRMTISDFQHASRLTDELSDVLSSMASSNVFSSLGKIVSTVAHAVADSAIRKKASEMDLQAFCQLYDSFSNDIENLKVQLREEETVLMNLKQEHKDISFLKLGMKKESREKIDAQLEVLGKKKQELVDAEAKLRELKDMFPDAKAIKEAVDAYEVRLTGIELKYAV